MRLVGIYRVTKKSLKKLVNSGIDVGLIKDSLRYTCYELSLSASMKINELLDDSIGLSTDEKIAVFVKLKRQKANSEETSETEDAQDGKDVFVTPDKIKELERVRFSTWDHGKPFYLDRLFFGRLRNLPNSKVNFGGLQTKQPPGKREGRPKTRKGKGLT